MKLALADTLQQTNLLDSVVRQHARMVYRIAYSVLHSAADAEDVVQETFLRALRSGNKITRIEDHKAWLARIAWRVAVERRGKLEQSDVRSEEATAVLLSPGNSADRVLLEKERSELLQQFIAALPDQLRDPLLLLTLEELLPLEVAATLGISEAAVRSRPFRARKILRERLLARMGVRK
jgi:RNA polymerase sigma-70 factor (ECF subfamily)